MTPQMRQRYRLVHIGPVSVRVRLRALVVLAALCACALVASVVALRLGDYPLSATDVVRALLGTDDDRLAVYFVQQVRAPRVLLALGVGAALGAAGAIFQQITGNPLGSPDLTGFTIGAATGAVVQIIVFDGGVWAISLGAVAGGVITGCVVYVLSRGPGLTGTRVVLMGIGVSFVLQGVNALLVVKADLATAQAAAQWLAGTLNAANWTKVEFLAAVLAVSGGAAWWWARSLTVMTSGNDLAIGLGVPLARRRIELFGLGIALVAIAVAVSGPIAFVALAAPQLAGRLAGGSTAGLGLSAMMGAVLVLSSDIVAQRAFAPVQLPVGVVTGVLGGLYLLWLLAREGKKGRR